MQCGAPHESCKRARRDPGYASVIKMQGATHMDATHRASLQRTESVAIKVHRSPNNGRFECPRTNTCDTCRPQYHIFANLDAAQCACVQLPERVAVEVQVRADPRPAQRSGRNACDARATQVQLFSNIHARESFRDHSFTAKAAFASLCGFGIDGYRLAMIGLATKIGAKIDAKAKT